MPKNSEFRQENKKNQPSKKRIKEIIAGDVPSSLEPIRSFRGRMPQPRPDAALVSRSVREAYKSNPFVGASRGFSLKVEQRTEIVAKDLTVIDPHQNKIADGAVVRYKKVDPDCFVKLYTQNLSTFLNLSLSAQKILAVVIAAIQDQAKDKAEIFLNYSTNVQDYFIALNVKKIPSRSTFFKGISDLISSEIIALSAKGLGWYWTNPSVLFNGSRVAFMEILVDERKEELEAYNKQLEEKLNGKNSI